MGRWEFAVDADRAAALSAELEFGSVVERIEREMDVLCRHLQACDDADGFARAVYCISVSRSSFDAFFNSEHGYRGAYFRSPHQGLAANEAFIRALRPKLTAWARADGVADIEFDKESLSTPSAKAWLAEAGVKICQRCDGEWTHPQDGTAEIHNGRWECADNSNAVRGRKAPFLTKIRILGAFLNERHDEFIPGRKRHRAQEIHEWGWS